MRYLNTVAMILFLYTFCTAQPLHPLQPSFLSASVSTAYVRTRHISKGFHLELSAGAGAYFSPFPPQGGAAPFIQTRAESRYTFGKKYPKGFGLSFYAATEIIWNPIFYKGERWDMDALWSIAPGAQLFWRFEPKGVCIIEPYLAGQCRFFTSFHYDTGVIPFLGFDLGVRCMLNKKHLRKLFKSKES